MSNIPDLRFELDRKVIDFLHNREVRRMSGEIHSSVIGIETGALWDVLSGLIDNDAAAMLAQLEQSAVRPKLKRYFIAPPQALGAMVIEYDPGSVGWTLSSQPENKVLAHSDTDAGAHRNSRMTKLINTLIAKGYKEIT